MRRPTMLGSAFALVLAAAIALAASERGIAQEAATPLAAATPVAEVVAERSAGVEFVPLGVVEVAGAEDPPLVVVLSRVTLPAGGEVVDDPHFGTSILHVEEGTVCYQNIDERPDATVTAHAGSSADTAGQGCAPPPPECAAEAGCVLEGGDEIALAAGDSVAQTQTRSYAYRNLGDTEAVVLISELRDLTGSPCGGAC